MSDKKKEIRKETPPPEELFQCAEQFEKAVARVDNKSEKNNLNWLAIQSYLKLAMQGYEPAKKKLASFWGFRDRELESIESLREAARATAKAQWMLGYCYEFGEGLAQDHKEAARWYRVAANQGLAIAQHSIALCYQYGIGVDKNLTEAFRFYELSANQGLAAAQCNLGALYLCGEGVTQDLTKAMQYFELSAKQEYSRAEFALGNCYENGIGVKKDQTQAVEWYALSAQHGHIIANYNIGLCYLEARGVARDLKKAFDFFQVASKQGFELARKHLLKYYPESAVWRDTAASNANMPNYFGMSQFQEATPIPSPSGLDKKEKIKAKEKKGKLYELGSQFEKNSREKAAKELGAGSEDLMFARNYYLDSANLGYAPAQNKMGKWYWQGDLDQDRKKAVSFFQGSADQGNAEGQYYLGCCYEKGIGVEKDLKEAVRLYSLSANKKNAAAQGRLGSCYEKGIVVEKNIERAIALYNLSAAQGDALAQCCLGLCYQEGIGVEKDIKEAVRLYQLSADQGNAEGQFQLGHCYKWGLGIEKNIDKAMHLHRLSAAQKYAKAQGSVGYDCDIKAKTAADYQEAFKWHTLAANQNYPIAQYNLALCYEFGKGVEKNIKEALKFYELSAEQGHAPALLQLRWAYLNGKLGVTKNQKKARELLATAVAQKNDSAQYILGVNHEFGFSAKKDKKEAKRLFELSAEQGFAKAQYSLGTFYLLGKAVVKKDLNEAVRWFKLAAEQQYPMAEFELGRCFEIGLGVPQDKKEAARLYTLSAERGHVLANYHAGLCYFNGTGVDRDERKAWYFFRMVEDQDLPLRKELRKYYRDWEEQRKAELCRAYCPNTKKKKKHLLELFPLLLAPRFCVPAFEPAQKIGKITNETTAQLSLGLCKQEGEVDRGMVNIYESWVKQKKAETLYYLAYNYAQGRGVQKNDKTATYFYKLSADLGSAAAKIFLAGNKKLKEAKKKPSSHSVSSTTQANAISPLKTHSPSSSSFASSSPLVFFPAAGQASPPVNRISTSSTEATVNKPE